MHNGHQCELLTRHEVLAITKMSKSHLYRKVKEGTFPMRVRIGERMVRWWQCEVEVWLTSRPRA